jgi:hypothetical protein
MGLKAPDHSAGAESGRAGRRHARRWRVTGLAAGVTAAALLGAAGPAAAQSAQPASRAALAGHGGTPVRDCAPSQLHVSVPAQIAGDPTEGMGNRAWNIVLRHVAGTACTITGWPRLSVLTAAGRPAPVTVHDVTFSNLGPVPNRRITLHPGQAAVATVTGAAAVHGCVTRWRLRLTLPPGGQAIAVAEPSAVFVPCLGGQLRLSPVQRLSTLRHVIGRLGKPAAVAAAHADQADLGGRPAGCRLGSLRATVTSVTRGGGSALAVLRLRTTGSACVLAETWPAVRVRTSGGQALVAKAMPASGSLTAAARALTSVPRGKGRVSAVAIRPGIGVSVPVLLPGQGTGRCAPARSATIYPTTIALGAGLSVRLPGSLSLCGTPRVLPFVAGRDQAQNMRSWAFGATGHDVAKFGWAGWWKGTDSAYPYACGSRPPYREPLGACSNGTAGYYGAYIGEVGSFQRWKGCGTGLNWLQGNYDAAQATAAARKGLGAAAYWFAAGPGRDPHYNGTTGEAARWGAAQGRRVARTDLGLGFDLPYVFMDIENNGSPPDENGWNTIWDGPCSGIIRGGYISPSVDLATEQAFASYIYRNTSYYAGVYSAGVVGYGSWGGIFGSKNPSGVSEWTFANETASVSPWPTRFHGPVTAAFFSNEPFGCALLWQWSGGNGVLNRFGGDLDQIDANHVGLCPGDGPKK